MERHIPPIVQNTMNKSWEDIAPQYQALLDEDLTEDNIHEWLAEWTELSNVMSETFSRLAVDHTVDTTDKEAEARYFNYLENILPKQRQITQALNQKLAESGVIPPELEVPMRDVKASLEIFRDENLELLTQESKLGSEYNKLIGAQTVEWDGEEKTILEMEAMMQDPDLERREKIGKAIMDRRLQDRDAINANWVKLLNLREKITHNAGMSNYRDYKWKQRGRHDYTPEDCFTFQSAIEEVVVPAAKRIYAKHAERLGLDKVRVWDVTLEGGATAGAKLTPFQTIDEFNAKSNDVLQHVHPTFGEYFKVMRDENLLDLDNRKGKAPGGYCTSFNVVQRPFIFMNAVGIPTNVRTLMHEAGHAFHVFETAELKYAQQHWYPLEFAEVASMTMELFSAPYWSDAYGGFYSEHDAARARIEHLEKIILFWPYMSVVDGFQHWVYENLDSAKDPANCDAKWGELWDRFLPSVDYLGYDDYKVTGWHRKQHIHRAPFYYIEYGVAQLGAVQIWNNYLSDREQAIKDYRAALALGGTATLPQLYETAGAKFAFDAETLGNAVDLITKTLDDLEAQLAN